MSFTPPSSSSSSNKQLNKDLAVVSPSTASISPPIELLEYYPLSVYLNGLLTTFNLIRVCCPASVALWMPVKLEKSIENASNTIVAYHNIEEPAFSPENRESFKLFCKAFLNKVFPHIDNCSSILLSKSSMLIALDCPVDIHCSKQHLEKVSQLLNDEKEK